MRRLAQTVTIRSFEIVNYSNGCNWAVLRCVDFPLDFASIQSIPTQLGQFKKASRSFRSIFHFLCNYSWSSNELDQVSIEIDTFLPDLNRDLS